MTKNRSYFLFFLLSYFSICFFSYQNFNSNSFLYDDAPLSLSYFNKIGVHCPPDSFGFMTQEEFPKLVFNLKGNCFPILHHERTGTIIFYVITVLNKFLTPVTTLNLYRLIISLILFSLYFLFCTKLEEKNFINAKLTSALFLFSPYFFYIYEPYLIEKILPIFTLCIHLLLLSNHKKKDIIAGVICGISLFIIKLTLVIDLIPIILLHFVLLKTLDIKYYMKGFLIGLLPVMCFNLILMRAEWLNVIPEILIFKESFIANISRLGEFVLFPASFYIDNLYFNPSYSQITEYIPALIIPISLFYLIRYTYTIKKINLFSILFFSLMIMFIFTYIILINSSKNNLVLYLSTFALYVPILINHGLSQNKTYYKNVKIYDILQYLLILSFAFTLFLEIPSMNKTSKFNTQDYQKISKVLSQKNITFLIVEHERRLNILYFSPNVQLLTPNNFHTILTRNENFGVLLDHYSLKFLEKYQSRLTLKFNRSSLTINNKQEINLDIYTLK
ncbi:MAG: hypothetical protein HN576_09870 [Bacteriovoracaceae bacterium]|jgi:hypothetical protein|nr:hypothetical protein [Bacteriovoracaceae bacterium]